MKKIAILIGVLLSIASSMFLLFRKENVRISDIDYVKIFKTECENGQFKIFPKVGKPSLFKNHFALISHEKGDDIIPLSVVKNKIESPFYKPLKSRFGCIKNIRYSRILSLKKNIRVSRFKLIDSKLSKIDFSKMKLSCNNKKVSLIDRMLINETFLLGEDKRKLFSENKGTLSYFAKREFMIEFNDVPYLLLTNFHVNCEVISNYTLFNEIEFFSLYNIKESKLTGTRKI